MSNDFIIHDPRIRALVERLPRWQEFIRKEKEDYEREQQFSWKVFGHAVEMMHRGGNEDDESNSSQ